MKLSGNYYEIIFSDQIKWTGLIGILLDIIINTSPTDWIKEYLEDVKLIGKKK